MFSTFDRRIRARETVLSRVGDSTMPARPIPEKWPAFRDFFGRKHDFFYFTLNRETLRRRIRADRTPPSRA